MPLCLVVLLFCHFPLIVSTRGGYLQFCLYKFFYVDFLLIGGRWIFCRRHLQNSSLRLLDISTDKKNDNTEKGLKTITITKIMNKA